MAFIGKVPTPVPLTSADITDGIISNAKLAQDIISAETELATAPADTDEFLISDAGTLKRIDASLVGGGGITEADQWRLTASLNSDATPISSNLERVDDASFGYIGSGMSVSSGVFTFPSTGYYLVSAQTSAVRTSANDNAFDVDIQVTTNNSSYDDVVGIRHSLASEPSVESAFGSTIVDVTDTSNVKVRFALVSTNSNTLRGDTAQNETAFTFIRLGDT